MSLISQSYVIPSLKVLIKELKKNKIPVNETYLHDFMNILKSLRISKYRSIKITVNIAVKIFINEIKSHKMDNVPNVNDMHEYHKSIIGTIEEDDQLKDSISSNRIFASYIQKKIISVLGIDDSFTLSREINPLSKIKYNYVMFDSDNYYSISDDRTYLTWNLNDGNPTYQKGYINLHSKLRNIKMMRLGRISYNYMYPTLYNFIMAGGRVAVQIKELNAQAILSPYGVPFHFLQYVKPSEIHYNGSMGNCVTLTSFGQNRGWFRFRDNFQRLDSITLSLWNLFGPSRFVLDATPLVINGVQMNGSFIPVGTVLYHNYVQFSVADAYLINVISQTVLNFQGLPFPKVLVLTPTTILDNYTVDTVPPAPPNHFVGPLGWIDYDQSVFQMIFPMPWPTPVDPWNFTLVFPFPPRFVGTLEFVSEDDHD